jgi:outer membrane protein assembly factor BamA
MAHYAFLDSNNIVTEVIVGKDETDTSHDWETYYGDVRSVTCKRTSYNTQGGSHTLGGTAFRKNYAGIGYSYDSTRDAFIPPKPYTSWVLNESTCLWDAPISIPTDAGENEYYEWNESTTSWNLKSRSGL